MRIGQLARRTGVGERMLCYYELQGACTDVGYRDYNAAHVQVAQRICMPSVAGLKSEIMCIPQSCIVDNQPRFEPCQEVRAALRQEVERLEAKLRDLGQSR